MTTYVLGVDPGSTTGLAIAGFTDRGATAVWSDQLPWHEAADEMAKRLRHLGAMAGGTVAVGEKFQITPKSAQRGQQYVEDAMYMLGVLRREARLAGVTEAESQRSGDAKKAVSDQILRNLKLYSPGLKHVNDAFRHVVLYALKHNLLEPRLMMGTR